MFLPANPANWHKWRTGPAWRWRVPRSYYDWTRRDYVQVQHVWPFVYDLVLVGGPVVWPGVSWSGWHRWLCFQNRDSGACVWVPSNEVSIDLTDYSKLPLPSRFLYD